MQQFRDVVASPLGRPIPGATITVTTSSGGTPTLYSDNGVTALGSNVLTADDGGEYKFYGVNGRYTLTIAATGYTGTTRDVILLDPDEQLPLNPVAYGADPTGAASSSTAVTAMLTALDGRAGRIEFPRGTFKLTAAFAMHSGLRVSGVHVDPLYGSTTGDEQGAYIWQSTASTPVFSVGQGLRDWSITDLSLGATSVPTAYTAPTSGKYGIKCEGEAPYSSYGGEFQRLNLYQFERGISFADATPGTGTDWQCDSLKMYRVRTFNCLHGLYLNTINTDSLDLDTCTFMIWTNGSGVYGKRIGVLSMRNTYFTAGEATAGVLATGNAGLYVADYQSDVITLDSVSFETTQYSIRVGADVGFASNAVPIICAGCTFEGEIRIERSHKLILRGCRVSADINIVGDDVIVQYDAPLFVTAGGFTGSGLRQMRYPSPAELGSAASVPTATPTTIVTFPASAGVYEVSAWITAGGGLYMACARFGCDGTTLDKIGGEAGANMALSVSGRNVRAAHTSGVDATVQWAWSRKA